MKTLVKTTLIVFAVVIMLIILGVYFISKYAMSLEEKTGLGGGASDASLENLSNAPPGRAGPEAIEVYTPLQFHVYKTQTIPIQGKAQYKNLLLSLNDTPAINIPLDSQGKFQSTLKLKKGANTIALISVDESGLPVLKQMNFGYYPKKDDSMEYKSYVGQVMGVDLAKGTFNLSIGKDLIPIKTSPDHLGRFKITETAGVIAHLKDGQHVADDINKGDFPFYFFGEVTKVSGNELAIKRKNGGEGVAVVLPQTQKVIWNKSALTQTAKFNLKDTLYVNGYVKTDEPRNRYYANSLVLFKK